MKLDTANNQNLSDVYSYIIDIMYDAYIRRRY